MLTLFVMRYIYHANNRKEYPETSSSLAKGQGCNREFFRGRGQGQSPTLVDPQKSFSGFLRVKNKKTKKLKSPRLFLAFFPITFLIFLLPFSIFSHSSPLHFSSFPSFPFPFFLTFFYIFHFLPFFLPRFPD